MSDVSLRKRHLLFIRHGETDWNRQQRFQGQIDVPLNDFGHTQAQRLGERLAAVGLPTVLVFEGGYAVDAVGVNAVNVLQAFG